MRNIHDTCHATAECVNVFFDLATRASIVPYCAHG